MQYLSEELPSPLPIQGLICLRVQRLYTTDPPKVKARSLRKRVLDRTLRWCQIGTQTYVVAESQTPLPDEAVDISALYDRGINSCDSIIEYKEDGVIGRRFHGGKSSSVHPGGEVYLDVVDANNHQITYGVLGSALRALKDYGGSKGFGTGEWKVYDGKNEVGHISVKSVT